MWCIKCVVHQVCGASCVWCLHVCCASCAAICVWFVMRAVSCVEHHVLCVMHVVCVMCVHMCCVMCVVLDVFSVSCV